MICPACNGRRRPCDLCHGFRVIIGPARTPGEQHRAATIVRMIGYAPQLFRSQR